jgi:segregation and condensation protein B
MSHAGPDKEVELSSQPQQNPSESNQAEETAPDTQPEDAVTAAEAVELVESVESPDASSQAGEPVASSVEHAGEEATPVAPAVTPEELALQVEVALMTTDRPMPAAKLADILGKVGVKAINQAVASLNKVYEQSGRSFRIENVANGLQVLTLPKFAGVMEQLHKTRSAGKLSPAAMETLAIIAYKQPILRVQIEAIRGVASGEVVRSLMERRLVKIVGRSEEIGRPMLYGTTKTFLETFGLSSLKDLPKAEDFAAGKGLQA